MHRLADSIIMATLKQYICSHPKCLVKDGGKFSGEFTPKKAVCPRCGTREDDEKFGCAIQRLTVIHFDPPTHMPGIGQNHRACDPAVGIKAQLLSNSLMPNPWHAGTGDINVVTCEKCKATPEYQQAMQRQDDE
jgi:hypothetical protein